MHCDTDDINLRDELPKMQFKNAKSNRIIYHIYEEYLKSSLGGPNRKKFSRSMGPRKVCCARNGLLCKVPSLYGGY